MSLRQRPPDIPPDIVFPRYASRVHSGVAALIAPIAGVGVPPEPGTGNPVAGRPLAGSR